MPGNRCEQCQKFVSLEQGDPEVDDVQVDAEAGEVTGITRLSLACVECGSELKEATVEFTAKVDGLKEHAETCEEAGEATADVEAEATDWYQDKDRGGRPIKSMRYRKHLYAANLRIAVTCDCGAEFEAESITDTAPGSGFDEI